jgi:tetraacyldisaccharide 4'-kinase
MRERLGLPVVLDPDRGRGVARAARQGAQLVLLDDAFQSPVRADRSAVIVLEADLERPPRCLPAGPAREGSDALRRADVLMVRCESGPWPPESARWESFRWHARQKGVDRVLALRSVPQGLRSPDGAWVDRDGLGALGRTLLVSGLARPESFEADARALGLDVVGAVRWADHVNPGPGHRRTLERMVRRCEAEIVVCPEKNLRRVWRLAPSVPLLALRPSQLMDSTALQAKPPTPSSNTWSVWSAGDVLPATPTKVSAVGVNLRIGLSITYS